MRNVLTIFKKEIDRVFRDKRMILSVIILPGLMIFLIYTFLGGAMTNMFQDDSYNIAFVHPNSVFTEIYTAGETLYTSTVEEDELILGNIEHLNTVIIDESQIDEYKALIDNEEWGLLIILPNDLEAYEQGVYKPTIHLYQNYNRISTQDIASRFVGYIYTYNETLSYNTYGDTDYLNIMMDGTAVEEGDMAGTILSGMLPMLIVMFLFSGAMAIGPESIAGEKERGTIATLLVTPVKRREIAMGKVLGLSVLSLLSATSSFIGIMASLPKMLSFGDFDASQYYDFSDYLMILLILFSTVFVVVGVISIISAYAKSLKEASSLIVPVYLLTISVAVTNMFSDGATEVLPMYLIPIYNTVQTLTAILQFDPNVLIKLLITIGSNIVYVSIFIFILNKMFNSEKIMFSK